MPTYDYQCDACNHAFEEFQSMTAPLLKKCPQCGKNKLRRLFGAGAAIIFKGSGFYQTDYRSDSYKQAAQKDETSAKPAGDNGKTDTTTQATNSNGEKSATKKEKSAT